jgi:hypothetical protein
MRFLILNSDYPHFMQWMYEQNPGLASGSYDEQMRVRNLALFGLADFYSNNLRNQGHQAWDLHINNETLQRRWAQEHNVSLPPQSAWQLRFRRKVVPWFRKVAVDDNWLENILAAQIQFYKPDVLLSTDMHMLSYDLITRIRPHIKLLVGQNGPLLVDGERWKAWEEYDLVTSSFPATVDIVQEHGVPAVLHRLGFDPSVLGHIGEPERDIPVSFVGSFFGVHTPRTDLLHHLTTQNVPLQIWGNVPEPELISPDLAAIYRGPAWGVEMFRILRRSKIVVNHHGDVAPFANNMRLYEATGTGALLITDWKENMPDMFIPGKEVVCYRSAEECAELVQYYLEHEDERAAIARAGQQRTLRDHTYANRIEELLDLLAPYIDGSLSGTASSVAIKGHTSLAEG